MEIICPLKDFIEPSCEKSVVLVAFINGRFLIFWITFMIIGLFKFFIFSWDNLEIVILLEK